MIHKYSYPNQAVSCCFTDQFLFPISPWFRLKQYHSHLLPQLCKYGPIPKIPCGFTPPFLDRRSPSCLWFVSSELIRSPSCLWFFGSISSISIPNNFIDVDPSPALLLSPWKMLPQWKFQCPPGRGFGHVTSSIHGSFFGSGFWAKIWWFNGGLMGSNGI